jgi:hypothetical protein
VLCKFADVLDSKKILLGTTLITYLGVVFMIGHGSNFAQLGTVTPPDNPGLQDMISGSRLISSLPHRHEV